MNRQKINDDVLLTIEEAGARAEVMIPAIDLNDIRIERDEYMANTASDIYDRVVYMVRSSELVHESDPQVQVCIHLGHASMCTGFWLDTRRQRQDRLKQIVPEMFERVVQMKKNMDETIRQGNNK